VTGLLHIWLALAYGAAGLVISAAFLLALRFVLYVPLREHRVLRRASRAPGRLRTIPVSDREWAGFVAAHGLTAGRHGGAR